MYFFLILSRLVASWIVVIATLGLYHLGVGSSSSAGVLPARPVGPI